MSSANNTDEILTIVNDLIKDIEEQKVALKSQAEKIRKIEESQKQLYERSEALDPALPGRAADIPDIQLYRETLESTLKHWLEEMKEEAKKHPPIVYQTKHYTIFNENFRAEHFSVVVNTVMKWVTILLGALSFISITKFLIHYR